MRTAHQNGDQVKTTRSECKRVFPAFHEHFSAFLEQILTHMKHVFSNVNQSTWAGRGLVRLPAIKNRVQPGSRVHTNYFFVVSSALLCTAPATA